MPEVGELSVRRRSSGGQVADAVQVLGPVRPQGRRKLVLLIHGYANSQSTASKSFDKCIANLHDIARDAGTNLSLPFFKFYWPGDTRIPLISELSYPKEIKPAIDSADRLRSFLANLVGPGGTPIEIHLVAHSLGSRLVLEMLQGHVSDLILFRSMSLMAAAVPVHKVQDINQLLRPCLVPKQSQVLFSSSDLVLLIAFRFGEAAAFEGILPEAVGSFGHPDGTWQQVDMRGYGHSDYWPSALAARRLAAFLEIRSAASIMPNIIPPRGMPDRRRLTSTQLAQHSLPVRSLL